MHGGLETIPEIFTQRTCFTFELVPGQKEEQRWNDWFAGVIVNLPGDGGLATVPGVRHLD